MAVSEGGGRMWGESVGRHLACEFAKGSDDSDDGCSAHIAPYFISTMSMVFGLHGVWVMGYYGCMGY